MAGDDDKKGGFKEWSKDHADAPVEASPPDDPLSSEVSSLSQPEEVPVPPAPPPASPPPDEGPSDPLDLAKLKAAIGDVAFPVERSRLMAATSGVRLEWFGRVVPLDELLGHAQQFRINSMQEILVLFREAVAKKSPIFSTDYTHRRPS